MSRLDEGTLALVREAARVAAREVLVEHMAGCPVNDLKGTVYGNGTPGLKLLVDRHEHELVELKEKTAENRGFWRSILSPLVTSAITAMAVYFLTWKK